MRPSEGGKYAGFGSSYTPGSPQRQGTQGGGGAPPALNEFQQDPLGALGKGLGWFGGVVGKAGKSMNEGWIQPTAQKVRPFPPPHYLGLYGGVESSADGGYCFEEGLG